MTPAGEFAKKGRSCIPYGYKVISQCTGAIFTIVILGPSSKKYFNKTSQLRRLITLDYLTLFKGNLSTEEATVCKIRARQNAVVTYLYSLGKVKPQNCSIAVELDQYWYLSSNRNPQHRDKAPEYSMEFRQRLRFVEFTVIYFAKEIGMYHTLCLQKKRKKNRRRSEKEAKKERGRV
jgi:hypothetical protein